MPASTVREQILETASELFYRQGVHAVGVDTIIARAGVAKSSLYRHFPSKNDLIAAYVQSEDDAFWVQWDHIVRSASDTRDALIEIVTWIGTKIAAPGYRGCPQLNVAAEFPDVAHPARRVATHHKTELRQRLGALIGDLDGDESIADQLWLMLDGAFANHDILAATTDPVALLVHATEALLSSAESV